ncbi:MAG: restriction endonuclease subunit S [Bdellovibrionales bacterium]|nr:restriction endonuclease subunit S [Bdellovibrionales bacterium]
MIKKIDLLSRHKKQVEAILQKYLSGVEVWAYGSRVSGKSHPGSDLDLVLRSPDLIPIPSSKLYELKEAFTDSNIPFLVEARDWAVLPKSFHKEIKSNYVVFLKGKNKKDKRYIKEYLPSMRQKSISKQKSSPQSSSHPLSSPRKRGTSPVNGKASRCLPVPRKRESSKKISKTEHSFAFKQTEIGEIPANWSVCIIDDLFDLKQGKSLSSKNQTGMYLKPFLRTSNVFWGRLDLKRVDEMDIPDKDRESLLLKKGDLLVCEGGDIGRTAIWNEELKECYYQNHIHRLRINRDRKKDIFPLFYMYWMDAAIRKLNVYGTFGNRTTIPNLSGKRLLKFKIPRPALSEQEKIAGVLSQIQRAIEIQNKLIETTKELKKSTMKQLFTYGIKGKKTKQTEIGEIPEDWNVDSVNNSYIFSKKPKNLNFNNFEKISFIPMDLIPNDKVILNNYIEKSPDTISSGVYFESGDLLLSKITPSFENGKQCIVTDVKNDFGIATTEVIPIKEKRGINNITFLFYYLLLDNIRSEIATKMEGTTGRKRVPIQVIKDLKIPLPSYSEQKKIADILVKIDRKIENYQKKSSILEELFKTMLKKLMTGKIRVHHLSIDNSLTDFL